MSNWKNRMKFQLILLLFLILSSCTEDLTKKDESKQLKLRIVETEQLKFDDFNNRRIDPCDTFSIEVENIYQDIEELPPAHLDTAYLDNDLKNKGYKTIKSGWGNFGDGPRILSIELSNGSCNCNVYKKYNLMQSIGENGQTKNYYKVVERIVCNALNNAVE